MCPAKQNGAPILICKIAYDGNKLHLYDANAITTKVGSFQENYTPIQKTYERFQKYKKRGFSFKNEDLVLSYLNSKNIPK